jgi:hypothetical protein
MPDEGFTHEIPTASQSDEYRNNRDRKASERDRVADGRDIVFRERENVSHIREVVADDHALLRETHDAVLRILAQHEICTKQVADHDNAIYGNGAVGLKSEVVALKQSANDVKAELVAIRSLFWRIGGMAAAVGSMIAGAVQAGAALFVK